MSEQHSKEIDDRKKKRKEYMKKYYMENKRKISEVNKRYKEKNKEKFKQWSAEYREKNKEKLNSNSRQYYQDNKEKFREYGKEKHLLNRDRDNALAKERYHNHDFKNELNSYNSMKARCYYLKYHCYKDYGGRGITVCDRWMNSFDNFLKDMGKRPSVSHTLDRINCNKNYSPKNCKWSTKTEQARNTRKIKVNMSQVEIIRECWEYDKSFSAIWLAKAFKTTPSNIYDIVNYRSWNE